MPRGAEPCESVIAAYDRVRGEIAEYELTKPTKARRNKNDDEPTAAALDVAITLFDSVKKDLLGKRLKTRFGRFTAQERADGMQATAPFAATLVDVVRAFRAAYLERKRRLGVMDFADLERLALDLLRSSADGDHLPSHDRQGVLEERHEGTTPPGGSGRHEGEGSGIGDRGSGDEPSHGRQGVLEGRHEGTTPPGGSGRHEGGGSLIAAAVRNRFAHVLVDEFQDVNPVQAAIVDLVRRRPDESGGAVGDDGRDGAGVAGGNLFVVGDVKQSIYRFRLAEPSILVQRWQGVRDDPRAGAAVPLSRNFRSRPEVLDFVNLVFAQLMRPGAGPVEYDDAARLIHGREGDKLSAEYRVELHLLERRLDAPDEDDTATASDDEGLVDDAAPRPFDPGDPAHWEPIEREAFLIGRRIREMMAAGAGAGADGDADGEGEDSSRSDERLKPLCFKHFAVLLRSVKVNAARVVTMLRSLGIPAYSDAGGDFLAALEVREVLAALHVLDNPHQDIPMASVLRTGLFEDAFTEDELVEIRCLDRALPFHAAVFNYARHGPDAGLRDRLRRLRQRIERYRDEVRRRPLAEFLRALYERSGYLAFVGGLPDGLQRRANLILLHERARTFGNFRLQGLHRFLRFIESMATEQREWTTGSAVGEGDDVVRVMSIHKAKGLEFPVVFVAGLGTRFNMQDRAGRMLFERQAGIGLRVVDPQRMIEYPSLAWQRVVEEIERTTRQEEMRVMYVALTRAREKLVLVGTPQCQSLAPWLENARRRRRPPSTHAVMNALSMLDWLMPVITSAGPGAVLWPGDADSAMSSSPRVLVHDAADITSWRVDAGDDEDRMGTREAASELEALPPSEPVETEHLGVQAIMARIDAVYPHLALASVPSVMAASAFKGTFDFTREGDETVPIEGRLPSHDRQGVLEERHEGTMPPGGSGRHEGEGSGGPGGAPDRGSGDEPNRDRQGVLEERHEGTEARRHEGGDRVDPRARGIVTHRVLQFLDFDRATDRAGVVAEIERLSVLGKLSPDERGLIDVEQLAWFVGTELAGLIRRAGDRYHREFQVLTAEEPALIDATLGPVDPADKVLVRGIVDGLLEFEEGLEIVDFKTDVVAEHELAARALHYGSQMALYARAMERLWRLPVRRCQLVFLAARTIVPVG